MIAGILNHQQNELAFQHLQICILPNLPKPGPARSRLPETTSPRWETNRKSYLPHLYQRGEISRCGSLVLRVKKTMVNKNLWLGGSESTSGSDLRSQWCIFLLHEKLQNPRTPEYSKNDRDAGPALGFFEVSITVHQETTEHINISNGNFQSFWWHYLPGKIRGFWTMAMAYLEDKNQDSY